MLLLLLWREANSPSSNKKQKGINDRFIKNLKNAFNLKLSNWVNKWMNEWVSDCLASKWFWLFSIGCRCWTPLLLFCGRCSPVSLKRLTNFNRDHWQSAVFSDFRRLFIDVFAHLLFSWLLPLLLSFFCWFFRKVLLCNKQLSIWKHLFSLGICYFPDLHGFFG